MRALRRFRRDVWYWAEQSAGRVWDRVCRDGVSCWLDWLPAYCTGRRYAAERAVNPHLYVRR